MRPNPQETAIWSHLLKKSVWKTACFVQCRSTCFHLFLTNNLYSFQNTIAISTGSSDFHKIIMVLKSSFIMMKVTGIIRNSVQVCLEQDWL